MKKTILSIVVLIAFCFSAKAQFSIMPKGGVTLTSASAPKLFKDLGLGDSFKSRVGFAGGVAFNLGVNEMFSIQPELLFIQKGFKADLTFDDGEGQEATIPLSINVSINYIEVPVLAKVSFGSETAKFFINAGPSIGIGLGGKAKYSVPFLSFEGDTKFMDLGIGPINESGFSDASPDWALNNRIDFGVQFGAGAAFQLGSGQVVLDARYGLGLTSLYKEQTIAGFSAISKDNLKSKNNVLAFTLGYMIPIGGN